MCASPDLNLSDGLQDLFHDFRCWILRACGASFRKFGLTALLGIVVAGCDSSPPPVDFHTMYGLVRANTADESENIAGWLEDFYPRIRGALPGTRDRQLEVWAQKRLRFASANLPGYVNESTGRIYVKSGSNCMAQTVCHEMVHALLDETWDPLPTVLEEGLCEYLAIQLVQGCALQERTRLLLGAATYLAEPKGDLSATMVVRFEDSKGRVRRQEIRVGFESQALDSAAPEVALLERSSLNALTGRSSIDPYHYGFGLWLVGRIVERGGVDALQKLCLRATEADLDVIPVSWILDAARVGPRKSWQRAVLQELGDDSIAQTVMDSPQDIVGRVAEWLRKSAGEKASAQEILDSVHISFGFGTERRVALLGVNGFREELAGRLKTRGRLRS